QAKLDGQLYYLLSTSPSSVYGLLGWAKAADIAVSTHNTVDSNSKVLYIKGTGSAFSKAWGGSKDLVYGKLSDYKSQIFRVDLTEKVGSNTWYRGTLNGKRVFIKSSDVTTLEESNTSKLGH